MLGRFLYLLVHQSVRPKNLGHMRNQPLGRRELRFPNPKQRSARPCCLPNSCEVRSRHEQRALDPVQVVWPLKIRAVRASRDHRMRLLRPTPPNFGTKF